MAYDDKTIEELFLEVNNILNEIHHRCIEHDHEPVPEEPPHEHPVSDWVRADSITPVPSNFDTSEYLSTVPIAPVNVGDTMGAFRFTANTSHLSYDDPIVYPGQSGAAHLHHFFGNTETNAHSTYESLRLNGHSTIQGDMINRSGYWVPALLDGKGHVVNPKYISVYYKRAPEGSPDLHGIPADLPAGLRFVFGYNYLPEELPSNVKPVHFKVLRNNEWVKIGTTLAEVADIIKVGDELHVSIGAPDCWDGIHVDSPNHRDHLAYAGRDPHTGRLKAPETHPYVIPRFEIIICYPIEDGDDPLLWMYSSDTDVAGKSLHGDYFEGWDSEIRQAWHDNAINKKLNCIECDLGNGKKGKSWRKSIFTPYTHLLPIPPKP